MDDRFCLELVKGLENVKKYHLTDGPAITILANLASKHQINDMTLLNDIAESLSSVNIGSSESSPLELTPQSLLDADILEKEIAPWVSEIRKRAFGHEHAPFSNRELALKWLSEQSLNAEQIQSVEKSGERVFHFVTIYGKIFIPTSMPALIFNTTEIIAKETGINHSSLIMYVLANIKFICPKWDLITHVSSTELPSGSEIGMKSVEIRFQNTLNFEDMRKIFSYIKREFSLRKSKQINRTHLEIYRLVNKKGIPLGKGKVNFWKNVTEEWNCRHPKQKYSWKGLSMAYSRILKKRSITLQAGLPIFKDSGHAIKVTSLSNEKRS